jgi:hypothetical protein
MAHGDSTTSRGNGNIDGGNMARKQTANHPSLQQRASRLPHGMRAMHKGKKKEEEK